MSDNKDPLIKIVETPGARAVVAQRSLAKIERVPDSLAVPRNDRMLASAGYLAALAGFWLVVPAIAYIVYVLKGRRSPFLGFHAVQAVLLQVAMIPIAFVGLGLAFSLAMLLETIGGSRMAPLAPLVLFTVLGLAAMAPFAATVWVGLCALRGQPRSLPLLGRWARQVVGDV